MSGEYKELIDRLAKAMNIPGGAHCVITSIADEDNISISYGGDANTIWSGIKHMIGRLFDCADDGQATELREALKKIIIEDEERRFQKKEKDDEV